MYVLPYGQMSLWGATVITNLMSALPWLGQEIVQFIWGGFSVSDATLNRFFALHFVLPFILAGLVIAHLVVLHDSSGSNNPLGISSNYDRLPFSPYYIFKDLITLFIFALILSIFVFYMPNFLGDSENYVMANPMQTPSAIVPEWYLLPFYAILRSIPNKLLGVIAMFSAILTILVLTLTDLSRSKGIQFRPVSKTVFFFFVSNFLLLMLLGAKHVEFPFIEFGQLTTVNYFFYFLLTIPILSLFENSVKEIVRGISILDITEKITQPFASKKSLEHIIELFMSNKEEGKWRGQRHIEDIMEIISSEKRKCKRCRQIPLLCKCNNRWNPGTMWYKKSDGTYRHVLPVQNRMVSLLAISAIISILFLGIFYIFNMPFYISSNLMVTPIYCDAPRPWGIYFQDSGSPQMEGLVELHDNILFYLSIILFSVGWTLLSIIKSFRYKESPISSKYLSHGSSIELIWTILPAGILMAIALPSFKLLYLMDEVIEPDLLILAEGHQWYWSYQYTDFLASEDEFVEFDSYIIPESDLSLGALRMLEVDNRLVIPELTHIKIVTSAADVIHSYACPGLGLKCDAYPGRLNQASLFVDRPSVFYGQCSEICGILHSSMPIVIQSVSLRKFAAWVVSMWK